MRILTSVAGLALVACATPIAQTGIETATGSSWLSVMQAREPRVALSPRELVAPDGSFRGQMIAAAEPRVTLGGETFTITASLGTATDIVCRIIPEHQDPIAAIRDAAERLTARGGRTIHEPASVTGFQRGRTFATAELLYTIDSKGGPLTGTLKVVSATSANMTITCQHDEVGYRRAFGQAVLNLLRTLDNEFGGLGDYPLARVERHRLVASR